EIQVARPEAVGRVGKVNAASVEMKAGGLANVGEDYLRRVEVLVVVAGPEFPPVVALVLAFAEWFGEVAEMVRDERVRAGKPAPCFAFGVVRGVTFDLRDLLTRPPGRDHDKVAPVVFHE